MLRVTQLPFHYIDDIDELSLSAINRILAYSNSPSPTLRYNWLALSEMQILFYKNVPNMAETTEYACRNILYTPDLFFLLEKNPNQSLINKNLLNW